jgi:phospholipase C
MDGRRAGLTRREALRDIGIAGLGIGAMSGGVGDLIARAAAASPKAGKLRDIEHVVFLMQENRSFDHYFGTLSGVRGFDDRNGRKAFTQVDKVGNVVKPFRLTEGCLPDLTHEWGPQHRSWNNGRMDSFVAAHQGVDPQGVPPETMGYYKRSDLGFYYALADAFTICDRYHCSVIGPTDPNRLMSMTASIDPDGTHGGPLLETLVTTRGSLAGTFTWPTMPEQLSAHHVSWKVYTSPAGGSLDNVLTYFKNYGQGTKLASLAFEPTYPDDFVADVKHDKLPQVSWLLTGALETEHPGVSSVVSGELQARAIVEALVSNPKVWKKTALFITWDENGGFFDHVAPPTPHAGTKGEFVTVQNLPDVAEGIRGPIGLGFRVPMLVVSPFTRGGLVCSDVFDHTSMLRFLETRFGTKVPNLTKWRRSVTGDLTSAFNFAGGLRAARPRLPKPKAVNVACVSPQPPVVTSGPIPRQERGKRKRPSGIVRR